MYKPSITPEAAADIVNFTLDNPFRKYHHTSIITDSVEHQTLVLHYSGEGIDYSQPGTRYIEIHMPMPNVVEMLKYAMTSITGAMELTQEYKNV